jgi:arylsulfatase A-like enzyme
MAEVDGSNTSTSSEQSAATRAVEAPPRGRLHRFFGASPRRCFWLLVPPLAVAVVDRLVRGRFLATQTPLELANYGLGVTLAASCWLVLVWGLAKIFARGKRRLALALSVGLVFPLTICCFPLQFAYFQYAGAYSSANTLPIAWQLRGTVKTAFLGSWASTLPGLVFAVLFWVGLVALARHLSSYLRNAEPLVPLAAGVVSLVLALGDLGWTSGALALGPDASFWASVVGGLAQHDTPRGLTVRTLLPLPPLVKILDDGRTRPRSVVLIISESVRADVFPSAPELGQKSPLDEVIGDRVPLPWMTSQASSTVISCVSTWTGLGPNVDVLTAHRAPLLFEMAQAAGYRTAYIGAQRGDFQRLGVFLRVAGLDVHVHGEDLDPQADEELGAPDDRAMDRALAELAKDPRPTFLVLHLSATHYPYRVDPPYATRQPMTTVIAAENKAPLWNRYRNAVDEQTSLLTDFFRRLRAQPGHPDWAAVFVSDHGEQFFEHGAFSHIRSLHDEELRTPAFVVGQGTGLTADERAGLATYRDTRVYNQDIAMTVLDLLGLAEAQRALPYHERRTGRSLLRPRDEAAAPPIAILANRNGIWGIDRPSFGAMQGARKVLGRDTEPFVCFDTASDPGEKKPLPAATPACAGVLTAARAAFPFVPTPSAN